MDGDARWRGRDRNHHHSLVEAGAAARAAGSVRVMLSIAVGGVGAVALVAALAGTLPNGVGGVFSGSVPSVTSSLPAGIMESRAIEISKEFVTSDSVFSSASAGPFSDVYDDDRMGPAAAMQADQLVWAVEYQSEYTICPPDGSGCWSPRPGYTTVILDYLSGDWITTFSYSPP